MIDLETIPDFLIDFYQEPFKLKLSKEEDIEKYIKLREKHGEIIEKLFNCCDNTEFDHFLSEAKERFLLKCDGYDFLRYIFFILEIKDPNYLISDSFAEKIIDEIFQKYCIEVIKIKHPNKFWNNDYYVFFAYPFDGSDKKKQDFFVKLKNNCKLLFKDDKDYNKDLEIDLEQITVTK